MPMMIARCLMTLCLVCISVHGNAETIRVGLIPWIGSLPVAVASAHGYWKTPNLDVQIIKLTDNKSILDAVKNRRVDLVVTNLGLVYAFRERGAPLNILAETGLAIGSDKIIKRNGVRVADLQGATVGVYLKEYGVGAFLSRFLATQGLKSTDIKLEEVSAETLTRKFVEKKYPLIVTYDPYAQDAKRQGNGEEVADSASIPASEGILAQPDFEQRISPVALGQFYQGWLQAVNWINHDATWKALFPVIRSVASEPGQNFTELDAISILNAYKFYGIHPFFLRNKAGAGPKSAISTIRKYLIEINSPLASDSLEDLVHTDKSWQAAHAAVENAQ